MLEMEGRLPDAVIACVGGGSNAIGIFHPFLNDEGVRLDRGRGRRLRHGHRSHAASITGGRPGVLHGNKTYLLQDADGQIQDAHSISAGLDYPGIGPEHAWLHDIGRAEYRTCTDEEALAAFQQCAELEGIIPALESAHAIARCRRSGPGDRQGRHRRPVPVGARRQGRGHGGRRPREDDLSRAGRLLRRAQGAGPRGFRRLCHGRRSRSRRGA